MVFGILLKEDLNSRLFFEEVEINLKKNFLKAPFGEKNIKRMNKGFYIVDLVPSYPKVFYFGLFFLFGSLVFNDFNLSWVSFFGLILFSTGLFWSKYFQFYMLRIGLKKKGFVGKVKLMPTSLLLRRLSCGTN